MSFVFIWSYSNIMSRAKKWTMCFYLILSFPLCSVKTLMHKVLNKSSTADVWGVVIFRWNHLIPFFSELHTESCFFSNSKNRCWIFSFSALQLLTSFTSLWLNVTTGQVFLSPVTPTVDSAAKPWQSRAHVTYFSSVHTSQQQLKKNSRVILKPAAVHSLVDAANQMFCFKGQWTVIELDNWRTVQRLWYV